MMVIKFRLLAFWKQQSILIRTTIFFLNLNSLYLKQPRHVSNHLHLIDLNYYFKRQRLKKHTHKLLE